MKNGKARFPLTRESFNAGKTMKRTMINAVKTKELTWFFHKNFSENQR
jgi:hypothetical protein